MGIEKKKKRGTSTKQKIITYAILAVLLISLGLSLLAMFGL